MASSRPSLPVTLALALAAATPLAAVEPRLWEPSTQAELDRGEADSVSVTPDGVLRLSPALETVWSAEEPYVFSLAAGPGGEMYAATGPNGTVYRWKPGAKEADEFFQAEREANVTALATGPGGVLYAGTAPEGKIYRIQPDGKWETLLDPETMYVWALHAAADGAVVAGTGEEGKIHRVTPRGEAALLYDSAELNVTVLVPDGRGNLLAGGDGNAMVYRIAPDGTAYVLYDSPLRQITSLAVGGDGSVYAAAVSAPVRKPEEDKKVKGSEPPTTKDRMEVVRIDPSGAVETLWASEEDTVFSLAWTEAWGLLAGTGKTGRIYALDNRGGRTLLASTRQTQVTALLPVKGEVWFTTSNLGRLGVLRPALAKEGSYLSPPLDAKTTARWGAFEARVLDGRGAARFLTRSGNTEKPDKTWSPWTPVSGAPLSVQSPAARCLQWKAELSRTGGEGPDVQRVAVTWLPQNLRPKVNSIEILPQGNVLDKDMAIRAMQEPVFTESVNSEDPGSGSRKLYRLRGWQTIAWKSGDPNEDRLIHRLFIRPEHEAGWMPLSREPVRTSIYAWDSTSLPDGRWIIRVEASDEEANPAGTELRGDRESPVLVIDHTPPRIGSLRAERGASGVRIEAVAEDATGPVALAEYSVDGGPWVTVAPEDGIADTGKERWSFDVAPPPGAQGLVLRVWDARRNPGSARVALPPAGR